TQNGETVYRSTKNLDPGNTLVEKLTVSGAEASSDTFQLEVVTTDGEELLRYSPQRLDQVELPEPRKPYDDPGEIETIDELWHAGNWTYKFRNTSQGIEYFEEALRRDPYDSRSRISLAELAIKHFKYDAALQHLDVAAVRDPDNGQIFYLRALAEESLGRYDAAYNHYYRATHFQSHLPRAYQRLAMLSLRKGNPEQATEHVNQAIRFNSLNPDLWVIRAISQRLSEMPEEAAVSAVRGLELDPISAWAARELGHAKEELGQSRSEEDRLVKQLLHDTQTAIEVALNYANCGLYGDAFDLLSLGPEDALSSYYRGFFKARSGQTEEAEQLFAQGSQLTPDYSFAFRSEAVDVFTTALQSNPDDGRAAYYLGLVYAKVSEIDQAVRYWKEATRRDPENARTWRDLGLAMSVQAKDAEGTEEKALLDSALEFYSKALESAPDDSRILLEHLAVQKAQDVPSAAQLSFLKQHEETVRKRDALIGSLVDLLIEDQQYAAALGYLEGNHFNSWEGGYGIHNSFIEANIGLAEQERDPELALAHYEKACTYPANLEVAPREPNLRGFLYVPMARLYGKLGNAEKARKLLEDSAREESDYPTLGTYYQALALKELGRTEDSQQALAGLREEAELMLEGASENYNRINKDDRQALGHYYLAKVLEEEGESALSAEHLSAARKLEPGIGRIAIQVAQRAFARAHQ
ncbi:MAG: tetratricopeptide repeat protein, partial [Acidobacteriota bacterium]